MKKVNFSELEKLNHDDGVELLKGLGYYLSEICQDNHSNISDMVSDEYYILEDDIDEYDIVSYATYYNSAGDDQEDIEIVKERWERVEHI